MWLFFFLGLFFITLGVIAAIIIVPVYVIVGILYAYHWATKR